MTVIVGEEVRTADGDLICLFLEEAIPPGLPGRRGDRRAPAPRAGSSACPTRSTGSAARSCATPGWSGSPGSVDWVETHNARIAVGNGNQLAAEFALGHGLPGIAVSDAHSSFEVGVAYTVLDGDPSTAGRSARRAPAAELVTGRASLYVRLLTPVAKVVQRARGNGRVRATGDAPAAVQ